MKTKILYKSGEFMKKLFKQTLACVLLVLFVFSSITVSAKPSSTRPTRVKNVQAKSVGKTTIKITYKKIKGVTGYKIYRSTKKSKGYKLIKTTKNTSFKNKNLKANTRYYYKVKAYKRNGKKIWKILSLHRI